MILLLYKPRKLSSNTAVNIVKKTLNVKKAGHLGTLDVEAEGLLPVTINSATKLFDYFLDKVKVYTTKIKFGEYSATYDLEGEITKVEGVVEREKLERTIQNYTGKILQTPPEYSAKKINGKRAYKLAEQGIKVELKPKIVEIFSIKILKQIDLNFFELEITCSAGTYIRALARDIAKDLSTSAVCFASKSAVVSFLVFCLLYFPCVSTFSVLLKEIGKKWTFIGILIEFIIAYLTAFIFYTVGRCFEVFGFMRVFVVLLAIVLIILSVFVIYRKIKNRKTCPYESSCGGCKRGRK